MTKREAQDDGEKKEDSGKKKKQNDGKKHKQPDTEKSEKRLQKNSESLTFRVLLIGRGSQTRTDTA